MSDVLKHAEAITRYRDDTLVDIALMSSLVELLSPQQKDASIRLFRVQEERQRIQVDLTVTVRNGEIVPDKPSSQPLPPALYRAIELQIVVSELLHLPEGGCIHYCVFPIFHEQKPLACLEITGRAPLPPQSIELMDGMLGLYRNYLSLLQYSQVDTLTRLLNRKTFEDSLHKLLHSNDGQSAWNDATERRDEEATDDNWLAIFDIDHFKIINDRYGHLFGDEVLLLMSDIMRQVFRRHDKLFRFGGEEFVVLLRGTSEKNALSVMERFLDRVAEHDFPQVGRVTISVGLTRIHLGDDATSLLGRADEALYFAKQNGRNQLKYYEALVEDGLIKPLVLNTEIDLF
ncbi:MAG TPA: GGDEF domain-containing protein [Rhodocyclaceae bacterium]|nr:GGDEF domain-containing protein [Rhodocyclaceae bacterium]